MIEIKCKKTQYDRLIKSIVTSTLDDKGRCFLGKTYLTCPAVTKEFDLSCEVCLRRNIKRVEGLEAKDIIRYKAAGSVYSALVNKAGWDCDTAKAFLDDIPDAEM